jgi:hypothetical protein
METNQPMTAIFTFFSYWASALSSGWLLFGDLLATVAVGIGVILEVPENPTFRQKLAIALVAGGVVVETICSLALFLSAEAVSQRQRDKIISLETRLAPRWLTSQQQAALEMRFARFEGKTVLVGSFELDGESISFGQSIVQSLRRANISAISRLGCFAGPNFELTVHVTGADRELVDALSAGLQSEGVVVSPNHLDEIVKANDVCGATPSSDATIFVATKFWTN